MISIIIPTHNEARHLPLLLQYLQRVPFSQLISEIIISDGNSDDNILTVARTFGIRCISVDKPGRAGQMNAAAEIATGEILYFLRADSYPPRDFANEIVTQCENGFTSGCFRLQFDHSHWFLKLNSWFTRFNLSLFRSGDQSLFVKKDLFFSIGKFREDHVMLEDQELIQRIKQLHPFALIPKYITTSARKYLDFGIYKFQAVYLYVYTLYRLGVAQPLLLKKYQQLIH